MANKSEASLAEILDVCSRFFKEMQQTCEKYKAALGGGSKKGLFSSDQKVSADGKKPKKKIYDPLKEDPNAPKKPIIQGYLLYYSDVRAQRQKDHPDLPNKDLTKIIAEEWNNLPKDKRQVYDDRSRKNREDYEKKVEEYLKTNPAMREALSKKKKKKRSTPSTQAPVAASQAIEVSDDSDDDNKNKSDDDDNINGKRPHSSSDDSSEDSDDIDSDTDSPKKVKK